VDIESEFEKTNKDYFDELQSELGDEAERYSKLFKSEAEIAAELEDIKKVLFFYNTSNKEQFVKQINEITDRSKMREILKVLESSKSLYNLIRLSGQYQLLEKLDFRTLNTLSTAAADRLNILNQREALESADGNANILNLALEDVLFDFKKISESELRIVDEYQDWIRRTREGLSKCIDHGDPAFISLKEELERLFKKKNLSEITQKEMQENIAKLKGIYDRAKELERKNSLLRAKYENDAKYVRIHKRLMEIGEPTKDEIKLFQVLSDFKATTDSSIMQNARILTNEAFAKAEMTKNILKEFKNKHLLPITSETAQLLNNIVMKEYLAEFHGQPAV
jgi:type I restriction enzyme R subunit